MAEPFTLPSGIVAELREMTGVEEELLSNSRLVRSGAALTQVMRNCTVRLGDNDDISPSDLDDLLAGDRLFIMVKLRQISLGDEVELELVCPNRDCGHKQYLTANLAECEVIPYGPEREFEETLPSGTKVVFVHLDGHMEQRLVKMPREEVTTSTAMLMRIKSINGNPPTKKTFNAMSLRDRTALRDAMKKVDGGIDTAVETTCIECGMPIRTRLESNPAFFFPEGRRS